MNIDPWLVALTVVLVLLAFQLGKAITAAKVRTLTFKAHKSTGKIFKKTIVLSLSVTLIGTTVKNLSGDVMELERFEIPQEISKAIKSFLIVGAGAIGGGSSPLLPPMT